MPTLISRVRVIAVAATKITLATGRDDLIDRPRLDGQQVVGLPVRMGEQGSPVTALIGGESLDR